MKEIDELEEIEVKTNNYSKDMSFKDKLHHAKKMHDRYINYGEAEWAMGFLGDKYKKRICLI